MATVRLSNEKRDDIVNNFTRSLEPAFTAEWNALKNSVDHERFIDTLIEVWVRHEGCYAILDTMPRKWLEKIKEFRLGEINGVKSPQLNVLETNTPRSVPYFMCSMGDRYNSQSLELNDPDLDELALKMLEHNELRQSIYNRRRDAERAIRKVVTECQTLKQLLEVWPAAHQFVDPADMETHRAVAERTVKGKVVISAEHLDTLNAGAVICALASAVRR